MAKKYFSRASTVDESGGATYRPLMMLSFALEYQLWGRNPFGYRQTNVLLHAACVLLVYSLARRVSRPLAGTGRGGLALAVAAVFAVHPLATSCVSYVSLRGRLMAAVGVMLALWLFALAGDRRGMTRAMASLAALCVFAFALFSAETALIAPVLVVVYLLAAEQEASLRRWMWVTGFPLVAAAYLVFRYQALGGWGWPEAAVTDSFAERAGWFAAANGATVKLFFVPGKMLLQQSLVEATVGQLLLYGVVGAAAIICGVFVLARGRLVVPEVWFGVAWGGALLLPVWVLAAVSGIVAEHWLYLAGFGVYFAVCATAYRKIQRSERSHPTMQQAGWAMCALVALLMWGTISRNETWRSESKLVAQHVAASPQSASLRYRYGLALAAEGLRDRAMEQFRAALNIEPNFAEAHTTLAVTLGEAGKLPEAIQHFKRALALRPGNPQMHFNLALAYARQPDHTLAIAHYREALALAPTHAPACNNLAWLLATSPVPELRDGAGAVELARRALEIVGEEKIDFLDTLAAAHAEAGDFDEAARVAQQAEKLAGLRGQTDLVTAIRARLKLYIARQPFHQKP